MVENGPLRILIVHNKHQYLGGEEAVVRSEQELLESKGHRVVCFTRDSADIRRYSFFRKMALGLTAVWSQASYNQVRRLLSREHFDIAHFHNFFPLISPAAHHACREAGVPIVQTLHNFRLLCDNALFFRDGHICEECVTYGPWRGIMHGCYRSSRVQTAAVACMLYYHRWRHTWKDAVDVYIALSNFSRQKFIQAGLRPEGIVVKPNFLSFDPGVRESAGDYVVYVGRLEPEKRVHNLLEAWRFLPDIPLRIVGTGRSTRRLLEMRRRLGATSISFLGELPFEEVLCIIKGSRFLVFPSLWYENFPRVLGEAFACGVPVLCCGLGSMLEIVEHGKTGLFFEPGSEEALVTKARWMWEHSDAVLRLGCAARVEFEAKYSAQRNYQLMMDIYAQAIAHRDEKKRNG